MNTCKGRYRSLELAIFRLNGCKKSLLVGLEAAILLIDSIFAWWFFLLSLEFISMSAGLEHRQMNRMLRASEC